MDSENRDCMMCNAPNMICDMVQCDNCELWAHYSCAGVTEAVMEQDWNCITCTNALQVPKTRKAARNGAKKTTGQKAKSDAGSSVGSISEGAGTLEDSLKKLEMEQRAKEKAFEEEMVLREKRLEMEKVLHEKRQQMEKAFREKQLQQERELKERQLQEERKMLEKELAEKAAFQERRKKMYDEFQKAKDAVAEPAAEEEKHVDVDAEEEKESSFNRKVKFWLKKQTVGKNSPPAKAKQDNQIACSSKQVVEDGLHQQEEEEEETNESDEKEGSSGDSRGESQEEESSDDEQFQLSEEDRKLLARLLAGKKLKRSSMQKQ
ncbi:DNA ligase 1-like [Sabethes cyaneus]|uniref:DNA ligase 1-like n=1 Tax=Sabethes cyaneus TaxID=53552 RepID=UPI00237E1156|nr:DNA ligase 1-like [Sabethes cyaneus]